MTTPLKEMSFDELFALFKHMDESAHKKENLFLGISLAIVPAVFVSRGKLGIIPVALAGAASVIFYWLHGIHVSRYGASQTAIVGELSKRRADFLEAFSPRGTPTIRLVRAKFRWGLVCFWLAVIAARVSDSI